MYREGDGLEDSRTLHMYEYKRCDIWKLNHIKSNDFISNRIKNLHIKIEFEYSGIIWSTKGLKKINKVQVSKKIR